MEKIFMDTAFLIAVIDNSDKNHNIAVDCYKELVMKKQRIITTEAILTELGEWIVKNKMEKSCL